MKKNFEQVAVRAALRSGHFIRESVGRVGRIAYEGRGNIVTDVDRKSEDIIVRYISSAFPDHSILSEEGKPIKSGSGYRWIIDPLDGTTNFSRSFPFFCVSIALEFKGTIELGVIYDPMRAELFSARRSEGAFLNQKKIGVSGISRLQDAFLATGFSYSLKSRGLNVRYFRKFLLNSLAVRRAGSAALDLCYVACGRFDGFWEMDLYPWDTAAGMIIVKEAGGKVSKFDGGKYSVEDRHILATNSRIHNEMVNILKR
jgi:myo-inositol-1(or 4)-monophosphatase